MAQLSHELVDLIERLKNDRFDVKAKTNGTDLAITVTDIDGSTDTFKSHKTHTEAFVDFIDFLGRVFDWSDPDTKFDQFMAEFHRRSDEQETKRAQDPLWNPATFVRADDAVDRVLQGTKQYSELIKLDRDRAVKILWDHQGALERRGIGGDTDLDTLINGDDLFLAQRKFSRRHGEKLIAAIERGEWKPTHQGLAIADDGFLLDGQHRCMAVAICGIPIPMMVTYHVDDAVFPVIDTGKSRSAGDILSMLNIKNSTAVATVIRLLYYYDNHPNPNQWYDEPMTNEQIRQHLVEHYLNVGDAYNFARTLTQSRQSRIELSATAMAAAHYIITRAWPAAPIEEFWTNVAGANIHPYYHDKYDVGNYNNNPGHALHRWAAAETERTERGGGKRRRGQKNTRDLIMILRAWNDINKQKVTQRYQWIELDTAPRPYTP